MLERGLNDNTQKSWNQHLFRIKKKCKVEKAYNAKGSKRIKIG